MVLCLIWLLVSFAKIKGNLTIHLCIFWVASEDKEGKQVLFQLPFSEQSEEDSTEQVPLKLICRICEIRCIAKYNCDLGNV